MSLRSTFMPLALSVSLLAGPVLSAAESPAPAREKTSSEAPAAEKKVAAPSKAAEKTKSASRVKNYVLREDVLDYLAQVSKNENIPLDWLKKEVAAARYSPLTQKYSTPKPNANRKTTPERNFALYKRNLLTEERIADGVDFVARNRATLERLEKELGVDRHVVAAVIGIESIYGKNMGRFRVIDALMTLSFDYTRRAAYYKKELAAYLAYCHREGLPVTAVRGSFAGAIGLGQFMPTSLFAYGKDGNGDGHVDIVECEEDGAASVANFLLEHGWKRGEKPLYPAEANARIFKATASGGIKAHTTVGALLKAGVRPKGGWTLPEGDAALLVDLPWILADDKKGVDYFVGTPSFSAILHYNRSYFYAAAVSMLADEIRSREIAIEKARRPAEEPAVQPSDAPKAVQS